jgi:hypothetical protein
LKAASNATKMFAQRMIQRAAPRFGGNLLAAPRRARYSTKFGESEFAKQKLHAEEHAASTTGQLMQRMHWKISVAGRGSGG